MFAGLYPVESNRYGAARRSPRRQLNDSSRALQAETRRPGLRLRCGFLGLLHMDIVQGRLEREYDMELITTAPTVATEQRATAP